MDRRAYKNAGPSHGAQHPGAGELVVVGTWLRQPPTLLSGWQVFWSDLGLSLRIGVVVYHLFGGVGIHSVRLSFDHTTIL